MIELVRIHRFHDAQIIGMPCEKWQTVGNPLPALAVLLEGILAGQHLWHSLDKSELLASEEGLRAVLPIEFDKLGLVVKEFQLAGAAGHVQVDHTFGLGRKMGLGRLPGIRRVLRQNGTGCGGLRLAGQPQARETERSIP